jgi:hypothetical protein
MWFHDYFPYSDSQFGRQTGEDLEIRRTSSRRGFGRRLGLHSLFLSICSSPVQDLQKFFLVLQSFFVCAKDIADVQLFLKTAKLEVDKMLTVEWSTNEY